MSILDKLFGLDHPAPQNEGAEVLLTTVYGNEEKAAIEALLRAAELPYRLSDRGAGGTVTVIMGYTMYGTDVYVRQEDLELARELLTPVDENGEPLIDSEEGTEAEEE